MDCADIPSWLTAIATVVGLLFVYCQLRGLNAQAKLQTYGEYTSRYAAIVYRFPESINSKEFRIDEREDRDEVMRNMRAYFDLCFEEWDLHKKGLVDGRFWETWQEGMRTAMSKRAFRDAWSAVRLDSVFGRDFEVFIEGLMR